MRRERTKRAAERYFYADFAEMGAILNRVCDAGAEIPADLHDIDELGVVAVRERRADLSNGISWAFSRAGMNADLVDSRRAKDRFDRLAEVGALAEQLAATIEDERNPITDTLSRYFPVGTASPSLHQTIGGLRQLADAASRERVRLKREGLHDQAVFAPAAGANAPDLTPGDILILELGKLFEEFTGSKVTFPQDAPEDGGTPYGPFVTFVMAVREHVGAPIVAGSVKSQWMRARNKARQNG